MTTYRGRSGFATKTFSLMRKQNMAEDKLGAAARQLGVIHGKVRAGTVKRTLSKDLAKRLLEGYENHDEDVMDMCPKPLSGEWVDDPTPMRILDQIANRAGLKNKIYKTGGPDIEDDLLDVYEDAYTEAFWETVVSDCKKATA